MRDLMPNLMPIGQFGQRSGLSPRALRLYHQAGLLAPAATSLGTGYRYYSREQLAIARRIRALRATGLPLAEIRLVLDAEEPRLARIQLDGHRARLERQIAELQRALGQLHTLAARYERQEQEADMATEGNIHTCSFCGKRSPAVERMIAGPNGIIICNECIDVCNTIIADERAKASIGASS